MPRPEEHPVYLATCRLAKALERLERGLQPLTVEYERDARDHQHLQHYARENAELKAGQEQLASSLSELQGQYEELQAVATTIYGKLDDSIRRLTQILEQ